MRQLMAIFALNQKHFFVAKKGGNIPHRQFALAGSGAREFHVVGAGAERDTKADSDIIQQQSAVGSSGGDFHPSGKTGPSEDVADLAVRTRLFDT